MLRQTAGSSRGWRSVAYPGNELFEDATAGSKRAVADDTNSVGMDDGRVVGIVLDSKHCMSHSAADFQVAVPSSSA